MSLQAINLLNTKYSSRVAANAANVQSYTGLAASITFVILTVRRRWLLSKLRAVSHFL